MPNSDPKRLGQHDRSTGSPPCPPRGETVASGFGVAYDLVTGKKGLVTAESASVPLEAPCGGRGWNFTGFLGLTP